MKAISLWQPWASLIAYGAKRVETRAWATRYRGPIAIHAAKTRSHLRDLDACVEFQAVVASPGGPKHFPGGVIVAVAELADVWRVERLRALERNATPDLDARVSATLRFAGHTEPAIAAALRPWLTAQEVAFGDYSPERWAWLLTDIVRLEPPDPLAWCPGRLRGARPLSRAPNHDGAGRRHGAEKVRYPVCWWIFFEWLDLVQYLVCVGVEG